MSAIPEGSVPKTDAALMVLGKFWSGGGIMHKRVWLIDENTNIYL